MIPLSFLQIAQRVVVVSPYYEFLTVQELMEFIYFHDNSQGLIVYDLNSCALLD